MLSIFDGLRNVTLVAVLLRMVLAVVCGGVIGMEREYKRRPAGFRTHILVCLGAAMTMLTSQYLSLYMHYYTDMTRLGAQVVAGIGFVGAGTIIVTRRQSVKGLTTAAGLWATAIVGLCIGSGFYEGALLTTGLILTAELAFAKVEHRVMRRAPEINLYIKYEEKACLQTVLNLCQEWNVKVLNMDVSPPKDETSHQASVLFTLRLNRKTKVEQLVKSVGDTKGVLMVEEI